MTQLLTTATVRRVVRVAHTLALVAGVAFVARHDAAAQAPLPTPPARVAANASGLPPIIDRELFFGNPEIAGAQLSPDGKYIAFLKPWKDTRNVWVKKTSEPYDTARLVTADTKRPIPDFFWTRDSKIHPLRPGQRRRRELQRLRRRTPPRPAAGKDAPAARNLTDAKGVRAVIYCGAEGRPRRRSSSA